MNWFYKAAPVVALVWSASVLVGGCGWANETTVIDQSVTPVIDVPLPNYAIPPFTGDPVIKVNDNVPWFTANEINRGMTDVFEMYAELDQLGRCGQAFANVCPQIMPTEKRGAIGMVKPSGWHTVRYDDLMDGKYLYNRCHLIAYQLAGENANVQNLITGTRCLNNEAMLPIENAVAAYVKKTGNHVLYRVTPMFVNDELVARGVFIEALSVEDGGAGIRLNVFCHNVQPGVAIDYATGESRRA